MVILSFLPHPCGFSTGRQKLLELSLKDTREKPIVIDMYGYRDSDIASAKTVDGISDIEVLPDRVIGGDPAVGYSCLQERMGLVSVMRIGLLGGMMGCGGLF